MSASEVPQPPRPKDWVDWHSGYDDPGSRLAARLRVVQSLLRREIDARAGAVRLISMCAGQGRDVIGVLAEHARRDDVDALLVEVDERNIAYARATAEAAMLSKVRILQADAALTDNYRDAVPADIVLACGIFGNISDDDITHTIAQLPMLCAQAATVLWTRGAFRDGDDTAERIRRWFAESGYEEVAFERSDELRFRVGAHRLAVEPAPFEGGVRLFEFVRKLGA